MNPPYHNPNQREGAEMNETGAVEASGDTTGGRIFTLDVLRGFALVGIALINVQSLTDAVGYEGSAADELVANFETFFVQGRFFPIFAFLFGVGFFIFMRNAERRGEKPRVLFARRLGVLLLFGVAHQFLQPGEALLPYAIFGFLLLPLYKVRSSVLLALSVPFLALGLGLTAELSIPGLFMLGTVCGRAGVFERPEKHLKGLRAAAAVFLALSGPALAFQWYVGQQAMRGNLVIPDTLLAVYAPGLPLAGLYVVILTLLLRRRSVRDLFRPLAAYGRMALTNYIGATLLLIGGAYALGLMGVEVRSPTRGLLLCLALYAVQIPVSVWWLSRFRMGPLEWVWRALTYGKAPPLSRGAPGAANAAGLGSTEDATARRNQGV